MHSGKIHIRFKWEGRRWGGGSLVSHVEMDQRTWWLHLKSESKGAASSTHIIRSPSLHRAWALALFGSPRVAKVLFWGRRWGGGSLVSHVEMDQRTWRLHLKSESKGSTLQKYNFFKIVFGLTSASRKFVRFHFLRGIMHIYNFFFFVMQSTGGEGFLRSWVLSAELSSLLSFSPYYASFFIGSIYVKYFDPV